MSKRYLLIAVAIMALVTYLPRVLPIAVFRRKIQNRFIQSFLLYMPYGILAAMIVPGIFFSTASLISGICGAAVAFLLAYKKLGLLPVAVGATAAVFVTEWLLALTHLI